MGAQHKSAYAEKLKDPRWQKKRLEILQRDNWECQGCQDSESTLHVHHCDYVEGNPWDTPDEFLMTLCEECHEEETLIRRTGEKFLLLVLRRKKFLASDIDYLAHTISNAPVIEKRDAESLLTVIDWSLRNKEEILRMRYERDFKRIGELRNG